LGGTEDFVDAFFLGRLLGGHTVVVFFAGVCFWVGVDGYEFFEGKAEG
jgi:hypothetical protein